VWSNRHASIKNKSLIAITCKMSPSARMSNGSYSTDTVGGLRLQTTCVNYADVDIVSCENDIDWWFSTRFEQRCHVCQLVDSGPFDMGGLDVQLRWRDVRTSTSRARRCDVIIPRQPMVDRDLDVSS
jgi:hypothetical protein